MSVIDKVALVTCATRGIGAAIADGLGAQGAIVVGTATSASGAEQISARFREKNIRGVGMVLDVASQASVDGGRRRSTAVDGASVRVGRRNVARTL